MLDVSSRVALIQLRALLAADAEIDLYAGKQLVLRATKCIANKERAFFYIDQLEAVLLSYTIATNSVDFQRSRRIGNRLLDAIEMSFGPN